MSTLILQHAVTHIIEKETGLLLKHVARLDRQNGRQTQKVSDREIVTERESERQRE